MNLDASPLPNCQLLMLLPCTGAAFLPADHQLTLKARRSVEAAIEAAAALAGELHWPEAATALRQQFGGGRVSVQVYRTVPGGQHWIHRCPGFAGDMRLAVRANEVDLGGMTIAHEVAHVLLRHNAELQRLDTPPLRVFNEMEAEVVALALLAK